MSAARLTPLCPHRRGSLPWLLVAAAPLAGVPYFRRIPASISPLAPSEPRVELGRYVKWPKYIRIQRQRKVLYQRLKVPPSINQFTNTLDKNLSLNLFKLLHKYRPEDATTKKERLAADATAKDAGDEASSKKPLYVKYGINHITKLCEDKKAQLVCIAHDVDPVEVRAAPPHADARGWHTHTHHSPPQTTNR